MDFEKIVTDQLAADVKFFAEQEKKHGAATCCAECRLNIFAGLYPRFHIYRRRLCNACGSKYTKQLKSVELWDVQ